MVGWTNARRRNPWGSQRRSTRTGIDAPRASALGVGHAPTDSPEVRRVALGFDQRVPEQLKHNLHRANP